MIIVTKLPEELVELLDKAAKKKTLARAQLLRQIIIDRLEADGFLKDESKETKK